MSPAKAAAPAGASAAGDAPPDKEKKKEPVKEEKKKDKEKEKQKEKEREQEKEKEREKEKGKVVAPAPAPEPEPEEPESLPKTALQIAQEEAEYRSMLRKQRFKRRWPEVTKVKIKTKPWQPPPPPQKIPPIVIELPELKTRQWVPPYMRGRRKRMRRPRILPEEMTQPLYESAKLKRIWHNFNQVEPNKMMLQGSIGCNSKRYSSTHCGSQTGCIAVICRALLEEKDTSQLVRRDVDDIIANGEAYYKRCIVSLKCYKGKPQLELNQLLTSFFLHDTKYTIKMVEVESGLLAKHPDNIQSQPDLMTLMEKRIGQSYMMILTLGGDRHFLIWGHPPPEPGGNVKTIAYIFDPHMLDEVGHPHKLWGAGAFLRYAGISSFVVDFLTNYGDLDAARKGTPKPPITLTNIEVVQKEPLIREPRYDLDFKALKAHCKSEWDSLHVNALIEKKRFEGQYPQCSLSAVSLATSRATSRKKVKDFYQKSAREPPPVVPVVPDKGPAPPTTEYLMSFRGEDFFLYCPNSDSHTYGRDDMIPRPKSETLLHSPVDIADKNFHSQYTQIDAEKWILRGTRHFASYRYQTFKSFTGIACCVAALGLLKRLRSRGWNEDICDETLDLGYNLFRESLVERGGPIRRLVLGELKENFRIRDQEFNHKERGIAVWGKMLSTNPKVFDLCRGIEHFFKESDSGILQIPGEFESAIWNEGGKYYLYHPWPADRFGKLLGLRDGGKSCVMYFTRTAHLCEHLLESLSNFKRRPFSISDVSVTKRKDIPQPLNNLNPVAPNRWVLQGTFHEGDTRFPEDHRNKQGTPMAIVALAMAHVRDADDWTPSDVDDVLVRGDILYQNTMEHLERMGISLESPKGEEEQEGEEEESLGGMLAAADVMNKFTVNDYDHIETEVMDSAINGSLNPEPGSGMLSLEKCLKQLFKEHSAGVVTARGTSIAVWKKDKYYYMFDPHGCDENGYPFSGPRSSAVVVRLGAGISSLAAAVVANLPSGADDSVNISPVSLQSARINPEIGAPETKLENKAFEWMAKGTAAILMGPRGENTAIGKIARKAGIGDEDKAGRVLALPAAAAFAAATESVPPGYMHQDHMYNFIDAGKEYYQNYVKKTGKSGELVPEDLTEKFEMGANTFSIELGEPIRLPLRLPDEPPGEGGEEEAAEKELGEAEEEEKDVMKEMKDALFRMWGDFTKPAHVALMYGDYHQLGVWVSPGGKVVAFDPAPTLHKGRLTTQRILKGDEIRLQRIKDEMSGEGAGDAEEEDEAGAEGEEKPEPEPEPVPLESCPALMVFSSPGEFIDKLVFQGGLDRKQCLAPYKLYPVKVINELTQTLRDKKPSSPKEGEEAPNEEEEEMLVEALDDAAMGTYFNRLGRSTASVRARLAQDENCFLDSQRDLQDSATSVMGIVVEHIEPYQYWKPSLVDAVLKYGDRLYTLSIGNAKNPPYIAPKEIADNFHVTNFNVRLEINAEAATGDLTAGETGPVLNMRRAIESFFASGAKHGVICAKNYCVGIWKGKDDKSIVLWEPHSVGPAGRSSAAGSATCVLCSNVDLVAETIVENIKGLNRDGRNRFTISSVKVFWEISKTSGAVTAQGAVPDEGYEWKVLTAYVETARGRTILRGTRPPDLLKFTRDSLLQSACGAVVACCMSHVRRPHLWTRHTVDEVMAAACKLFVSSLGSLGYEFRPGDDVLLPLQVMQRFVLGVNYIRFDLQQVFSGKLEQKDPSAMTVRCALERFFETHTHGVLWSVPHAVAVWRVAGAPPFYMMEPHACGPTGLRIDAQDDGAACVLTFTSAKLMAFAYLQNIPVTERPKHEFQLYAMSMTVQPIKKMGGVDPPLVRAPPSQPGAKLVPATSKVDIQGKPRRAAEGDRQHPPGSATCLDAQRASEKRDKEISKLKGQRNTSGWLVLNDGTQFLSAQHSMACRKFPYASRGNQALSCCVMSVAMSAVIDVCRWCGRTLDSILEAGDQLHQDSYLHFKPKSQILNVHQILRKFYTPGNCVCRVVVYKARQGGTVDENLLEQVTEFFREEKAGVFVAGNGDFAVALFRTPRGFYMFDPADRDRYGRAVAPPCRGKARACFSQYPNVQTLVDKLGPNIPPVMSKAKVVTSIKKRESAGDNEEKIEVEVTQDDEEKEVKFEESASFKIYGMDVTSLRKLNRHEK